MPGGKQEFMLTAGQTKKVDIPHEEGEWAEIRMLSWKQRAEAEQNKASQLMDTVKNMGAETFQTLRGMTAGDEQRVKEQTERDPLNSFDMETVLKYGLLRLSYAETMGPDVIEDLDGDTAAFLAREIINYSTRAKEEGKGSSKK